MSKRKCDLFNFFGDFDPIDDDLNFMLKNPVYSDNIYEINNADKKSDIKLPKYNFNNIILEATINFLKKEKELLNQNKKPLKKRKYSKKNIKI